MRLIEASTRSRYTDSSVQSSGLPVRHSASATRPLQMSPGPQMGRYLPCLSGRTSPSTIPIRTRYAKS